MASELESMRERLYAFWLEDLEEEVKFCGESNTLHNDFEPMTWNAMHNKIVQLQQIKQDSEYQISLQQFAVQEAFKQLANRNVDAAIMKHTQSKLSSAEMRTERYKQVSDMLGDQLMYADCLWILVNNDIYRMEKIDAFTQTVNSYETELAVCAKRIELMRMWMPALREESYELIVQRALLALEVHQPSSAERFAEHFPRMYKEINYSMEELLKKLDSSDELETMYGKL